MELFWLKTDNKPNENLYKFVEFLTQYEKIRIEILKHAGFDIFINNKINDALTKKINWLIKEDIDNANLIFLLKKMNVSNWTCKIKDKVFYVDFIEDDNLLIISTDKINNIKIKEPEQEKKDIGKEKELNIDDLKDFKFDKNRDLIPFLKRAMAFCIKNWIWDIYIDEWDYPYFIAWEYLFYNEDLDSLVKKSIFQWKVITFKEMNKFFKDLIENKAKQDPDETKQQIIKDEIEKNFTEDWGVDITMKSDDWNKVRINVSKSNGKLGASMRVIESTEAPKLEDLWLVDETWKSPYRDVLKYTSWLVMVVWPTGSWKSFSLTAMLWEINRTQRKNIITLEDPIEFEHTNILSKFKQKEVWVDVSSYSKGIKFALRQKPHIVVLWEIRDAEIMENAIELANTWHVVFCTFHANNVMSTISRILDFFPDKVKSIREQLGEVILWIFVQKLVSRKGGWKILIKEILVKTEEVKEAIINGELRLLENYMSKGSKEWMVTNDNCIIKLVNDWLIEKSTAVSFAKDKNQMINTIDYNPKKDK